MGPNALPIHPTTSTRHGNTATTTTTTTAVQELATNKKLLYELRHLSVLYRKHTQLRDEEDRDAIRVGGWHACLGVVTLPVMGGWIGPVPCSIMLTHAHSYPCPRARPSSHTRTQTQSRTTAILAKEELARLAVQMTMAIISPGIRKQRLKALGGAGGAGLEEKDVAASIHAHREEMHHFVWKRRVESRAELLALFQIGWVGGDSMNGRGGGLGSGTPAHALTQHPPPPRSISNQAWVRLPLW